ncbi:hypothetical protein [Amycolatopsis sp. NPDC049159]|uniref:hypothetical protein n=1 Tax=unclassified Amycolatopsis TaxID=2618356 RepID=UPI0033E8E8AE
MTTEPDAARIAAAVRTVPGVTGLHGGRFGEIATLDPPRRVVGVRVREDEVTVAVIAQYPVVAGAIATAVRAAAGVTGRPVHVVLADLTDPPATEEEPKEKVS